MKTRILLALLFSIGTIVLTIARIRVEVVKVHAGGESVASSDPSREADDELTAPAAGLESERQLVSAHEALLESEGDIVAATAADGHVTISGRVTWPADADRVATVSLTQPMGSAPGRDTFGMSWGVAEGAPAPDGTFQFTDLLPGRYTVTATARRWDPAGKPEIGSYMGLPMASADVDARFGGVDDVRLDLPRFLLLRPRPAALDWAPLK